MFKIITLPGEFVVERRRMDYNHYRPHRSLGYRSPAAFAATLKLSYKVVHNSGAGQAYLERVE